MQARAYSDVSGNTPDAWIIEVVSEITRREEKKDYILSITSYYPVSFNCPSQGTSTMLFCLSLSGSPSQSALQYSAASLNQQAQIQKRRCNVI